jgi:hypothetical protein
MMNVADGESFMDLLLSERILTFFFLIGQEAVSSRLFYPRFARQGV